MVEVVGKDSGDCEAEIAALSAAFEPTGVAVEPAPVQAETINATVTSATYRERIADHS
jgi:hypothetical protein